MARDVDEKDHEENRGPWLFKVSGRTIALLATLWILGLGLAIWSGLGWFFLLEAARRMIVALPFTYIPFLRLFVSPSRAEEERRLLQGTAVRLMYGWRLVIALIWLVLTGVVFRYANIRIVDLLN